MKNPNSEYYWKCPKCGKEQKVMSSFFMTDCGSNEKCCECGKRVHCHHPVTPFEKKQGDVTAYEKE